MAVVFISYSRKNQEFAKQLHDWLGSAGHEPWIDWDDIPFTAQWWNTIKQGIERANDFVLIMTPDSMMSPIVHLELAHAHQCNKRIIPVVREEVIVSTSLGHIAAASLNPTLAEMIEGGDLLKIGRDNWKTLSETHWIFIRADDDFEAACNGLLKAIETDLDYVETHTHLYRRAHEWSSKGQRWEILLFGEEITGALAWLEQSASKKPPATNLHRDYIQASHIADKRRRQIRQGTILTVTSGIAIMLVVLLVLYFRINTAQTRLTDVNQQIATVQAQTTLFALAQDRIAELAEGGVIVPQANNLQTPPSFIATLTQVANFNTWEPIIEEDTYGVEMVLVPAGCFWMGSIFQPNEQPINEICFDDGFWIDRYEVSNEQYERIGGTAINNNSWSRPAQPRTDITWFEAQAYCALRQARLPTEAEWEYAARGPKSLIYPWGNEFVAENVVYRNVNEPADIGELQRAGGISWVGAYDMSGNVWEWTNTIYDQVQFPYPYNPNDGRERFSENTNVIRVSRGGAFSDVPLEYPVRIAFRGANLSNWSSPATGVRCVRSDFFNDLTLQTPTSTNTMPRTPSPTITTTPVSAIPSISISAVNVGFYGERPIGIGCFVYITVVATGNPEGSICVANGAVTDCNYPAGYPSPFTFPTGSTNYQIHLGGIREDGFGTHSVWVSTNYGDSNTLTLACQ